MSDIGSFLEELSKKNKEPRTFQEYLIPKYGKAAEEIPYSLWNAELNYYASKYFRKIDKEVEHYLPILESEEKDWALYLSILDRIKKSKRPIEWTAEEIIDINRLKSKSPRMNDSLPDVAEYLEVSTPVIKSRIVKKSPTKTISINAPTEKVEETTTLSAEDMDLLGLSYDYIK